MQRASIRRHYLSNSSSKRLGASTVTNKSHPAFFAREALARVKRHYVGKALITRILRAYNCKLSKHLVADILDYIPLIRRNIETKRLKRQGLRPNGFPYRRSSDFDGTRGQYTIGPRNRYFPLLALTTRADKLYYARHYLGLGKICKTHGCTQKPATCWLHGATCGRLTYCLTHSNHDPHVKRALNGRRAAFQRLFDRASTLFPGLASETIKNVIDFAWTDNRVGKSTLPVDKRIFLAIQAYLRHNATNYDAQLANYSDRGVVDPKRIAREEIRDALEDLLASIKSDAERIDYETT